MNWRQYIHSDECRGEETMHTFQMASFDEVR